MNCIEVSKFGGALITNIIAGVCITILLYLFQQWSFIKSLYPSLDDLKFIEVESSLSSEFFEQLNLTSNSSVGNSEFLVIKNKFVNRCNLMAMGIVQFVKKT